jgi:hypothetical protein
MELLIYHPLCKKCNSKPELPDKEADANINVAFAYSL